MLMLDICSGLGGASEPFRAAGWSVITVDVESRFDPTFVADVREFRHSGPRPTFVWCSPPCTEFARESMPWSRTGRAPDLSLVEACIRIIREARPYAWALENVRGAIAHIDRLESPEMGGLPMSRFRLCMAGPVAVWSNLVPLGWPPAVPFWKEKLSSKQRAERAKIPPQIGEAFRRTLESDLFATRETA
jgi:hypothetical protein